MRKEQFLPLGIAIAMFFAAVPYWWAGDWRRGSYWIAAGVINVVVTV